MTEGVQIGKIYEGRVSSVKDFGAFVEIIPGKDGLVHISELAEGYVSNVAEVCRVGDMMLVKVIAVDDQDRVKLSRKAAMIERGLSPAVAGGGGGGGGGEGGGPGGGQTGGGGGGRPPYREGGGPPRRPDRGGRG